MLFVRVTQVVSGSGCCAVTEMSSSSSATGIAPAPWLGVLSRSRHDQSGGRMPDCCAAACVLLCAFRRQAQRGRDHRVDVLRGVNVRGDVLVLLTYRASAPCTSCCGSVPSSFSSPSPAFLSAPIVADLGLAVVLAVRRTPVPWMLSVTTMNRGTTGHGLTKHALDVSVDGHHTQRRSQRFLNFGGGH